MSGADGERPADELSAEDRETAERVMARIESGQYDDEGMIAAIREADGDSRHAAVVREATDLCWKATPYGSDENGYITSYLLPAGVVHRLLGALQGAGYSAAFRVPRGDGDA